VADEMWSLAHAVPWRHLVGFENRLKSEDQIRTRIAEDIRVKGHSVDEGFATLNDAIRYTFQYPGDRYTEGVQDDIRKLTDSGFTMVKLKNAWEWPEYKGIIGCWRNSAGVVFEVQFHTLPSYEAWQLTQPAYERLRNPATSDPERAELRAFIRKVYGFFGPDPGAPAPAPAPASVAVTSGEKVTYYAIVDALSRRESPAGVLRRIEHAGGERDEAFGRDLAWRPTFLLYSAERGNLDNDMPAISEEEADRIVARVRGGSSPAISLRRANAGLHVGVLRGLTATLPSVCNQLHWVVAHGDRSPAGRRRSISSRGFPRGGGGGAGRHRTGPRRA